MSEGVAERLVALRQQAGSPTQKAVARAIGCAYRSYQNWEQNVVVPSWKNATRLARFYESTPEYILHGIDGSTPSRVEVADLNRKLDALAQINAMLVKLIAKDGDAKDRAEVEELLSRSFPTGPPGPRTAAVDMGRRPARRGAAR